MKRNQLALVFGTIILILMFIPYVNGGAFSATLNDTLILVDGATRIGTNVTNGVSIYTGDAGAAVYRGWVVYDISGLTPGIHIDTMYFRYQGTIHNDNASIVSMTVNPIGTDPNTIFWDIGNGTVYHDGSLGSGFPVVAANQQVTLNAQAITDLETAVNASQTWFALGFIAENEAVGHQAWFAATENGAPTPEPTLYIEYDYDYMYQFTGAYYENNTAFGGLFNISDSDGGRVAVNGNTTTKGYSTPPEAFYWDIGGGFSRSIFTVGASENFTVYLPESTFYVYQFTIKDHTGKTGLGTSYLEAYRTIGGTEHLIERMKIYMGNPVPLNLVYGKTYHLKVLFADGTRYDWGYFMAGGTSSINLILKGVTFQDQAQVLYNDISVEATRNAAGDTITVNYLDLRGHTVWANVTISVRNGAIVQQIARNNNSYVVNWALADPDTNYMVVVRGDHSDYGEWGRSFILDAGITYPDAPDLNGIFGDIHSDFIPFVICMVGMLTFSRAMQEKSLIATMFLASMFKLINWASWSYNLLAFGWFIAIGVVLTARGGNT